MAIELWDVKNDIPACGWDGSPVITEGSTVFVKELRCQPQCGCGGCEDFFEEYPIDGTLYWWKDTEKHNKLKNIIMQSFEDNGIKIEDKEVIDIICNDIQRQYDAPLRG